MHACTHAHACITALSVAVVQCIYGSNITLTFILTLILTLTPNEHTEQGYMHTHTWPSLNAHTEQVKR